MVYHSIAFLSFPFQYTYLVSQNKTYPSLYYTRYRLPSKRGTGGRLEGKVELGVSTNKACFCYREEAKGSGGEKWAREKVDVVSTVTVTKVGRAM